MTVGIIVNLSLTSSCLLELYASLCEQLSEGGGLANSNEFKSSVIPLAQSLDSKLVL